MEYENICKHCKEKVAIRNPSGFCDHLYYPDNCEICKRREVVEMEIREKEMLLAAINDLYNWNIISNKEKTMLSGRIMDRSHREDKENGTRKNI